VNSVLSIRVVSKLEEFSGLADQWNALLAQSSSNNLFLTWEWLYTWAKNYLGEDQLFILLISEEGQPVGIAPFYIRKVRYYRFLNLRQIEFLGSGEVCSSYLDLIVQEKKRKQIIRALYAHLYGEAKRLWDLLYLAEVPVESTSIDVLYDLAQEDGKVIEMVGYTCCPLIKLNGNVEDFLKGISPNERYNLRRKSKRLQQAGHVEYSRVSSDEEIQKEMDTFIKLHQMRWEQKGFGGAFKSQRFLTFHREISSIFSKIGWARLDFLILNGEKLAGNYGYRYNNRYYFYLPGLNPFLFPEVSPGILLLFYCIKLAIQEECAEIDLLRGTAGYKMAWASGVRRSTTLRLYNRHFKSVVFNMMESGKQMAKVLVR